MVLLPNTTFSSACEIAEELRRRVESLEITIGSRECVSVTISLGVATGRPGSGYTVESLIAAADRAMYRAKERGKNRVSALT